MEQNKNVRKLPTCFIQMVWRNTQETKQRQSWRGDSDYHKTFVWISSKNLTSGEGEGLHALPLLLYLPSRAMLWCTLQLRGQIHSSYFSSTLFSSVVSSRDPFIVEGIMALDEVSCSFAVVLFGSNPPPPIISCHSTFLSSLSLFFFLCCRFSPAFASLRYRGVEPKNILTKLSLSSNISFFY